MLAMAGEPSEGEGRKRNDDGTFKKEDVPSDGRHSRSTEYPHGNSADVRARVVQRHTDAKGNVIDPADGSIIPPGEITIEHTEMVVDHWNRIGHNQTAAERRAWYEDERNLTVKRAGPNKAEGASSGKTFRQDTGQRYQR
jgi:hypothetical protein